MSITIKYKMEDINYIFVMGLFTAFSIKTRHTLCRTKLTATSLDL